MKLGFLTVFGCIERAGNCDTGQSHLKVQHIPLDARQHGPVELGLLVKLQLAL